jgi:hypothetical protein
MDDELYRMGNTYEASGLGREDWEVEDGEKEVDDELKEDAE